MNQSSKNQWDQRYSGSDFFYGVKPNAFLVAQKARFQPGMRALALADGEGRNGVWLAEQGLDVLSVDGSAVGLQKAEQLARARNTRIRTACADLATWDWPRDEFDVVISIFAHFGPEQRPLIHRRAFESLKPGGLFILEAFNPSQLQYKSGGPPIVEMLYSVNHLKNDFPGVEFLELKELETDLAEGEHHVGRAAVVRLIFCKPG